MPSGIEAIVPEFLIRASSGRYRWHSGSGWSGLHARPWPQAVLMPVCNTHVAGMQSTATKNVCTATASLLAGFGDNGSYSLRPIPIWFSRRPKAT